MARKTLEFTVKCRIATDDQYYPEGASDEKITEIELDNIEHDPKVMFEIMSESVWEVKCKVVE